MNKKKIVAAPIRETELIILNNKANNIMAKLNDIMQKYFHKDTILEPQSESILTLTNTLLGSKIILVGKEANVTSFMSELNYGIFTLKDLKFFIDELLKKNSKVLKRNPNGISIAIEDAQKKLYNSALAKLTEDAGKATKDTLPKFMQRIENIIKYKNECHIDDELPNEESLTNMVKKAAEDNEIITRNYKLANEYKAKPIITPKEAK